MTTIKDLNLMTCVGLFLVEKKIAVVNDDTLSWAVVRGREKKISGPYKQNLKDYISGFIFCT